MISIEKLQTIPNLQIILADEGKIICSVKISVKRMEDIVSGSMMFSHARYITFGQTVVFTDKTITDDQSGALFFNPKDEEEAIAIISSIADRIPHEKEQPKNCEIL